MGTFWRKPEGSGFAFLAPILLGRKAAHLFSLPMSADLGMRRKLKFNDES
jgi:hypothetical protein